jgi:hypothetical protein
MTAEELMRQAHLTAHEYAKYGVLAYEELFGVAVSENPMAAATFVAAFMRTAAHDFDVGIRERAQ